MKKLFIFDFDGVLCNSTRIAYAMHNYLCGNFGLPKVYDKKSYFKTIDGNSISNYLDNKTKEEYNFLHRELMFQNLKKTKLFKDVNLILKIKNFNFCIVSSNYEKTIHGVFDKYPKFSDKIQYILGRETLGIKKDKVNYLCKLFKVNKEDVIYVGDTYSDILFCQEIGINILVVDYGYSDTKSINSKNIIGRVNSIKKLIRFINKNNEGENYGRKI